MEEREEIIKMIKDASPEELAEIIENLEFFAQEVIVKTIEGQTSYQDVLKAIQSIQSASAQAEAAAEDWVSKSIAKAYIAGVDRADKVIKKLKGIDLGYKGRLTVELLRSNPSMIPHLESSALLASDAFLDFGTGIQNFNKSAKHILNTALKKEIQNKISADNLEGVPRAVISREIKKDMQERGFTALIDRGGKKWKLKAYTDMLVRTHLLKANGQATINRAVEFGINHVEVSGHRGACQVCQPYEGKIYSINGKGKYPRLPISLPIHPNCRHSFLLRPDID